MKKLFISIAAVIATLGSCQSYQFEDVGLLVPLTVTADSSLPSITVNNTQLHVQTFGNPNDPIIIALHGGPGADFRSILNCSEFATDDFFVVFYDQRGTGLSQRHDADIYTVQLFIDDLDAVISYYQQNLNQKVILLGHSWGAMLATAYVNQYPEKIDGVVLIEPGGLTWEDTESYIGRSRTLELFNETTNDFVYLDQFISGNDHLKLDYKATLSLAADFASNNKVGNEGPYPYWRPGSVSALASFRYVVENPFDFTTNLNNYTAEILFVYSELNEAYGKEHAKLVSSAYPNSQLAKINGTGHEVVFFGWDNFYPVAQNYLNKIK